MNVYAVYFLCTVFVLVVTQNESFEPSVTEHISPEVLKFESVLLLFRMIVATGYGDGAGNTVEENTSVFSLIRMCWLPSVL